jgi:hypothetical protein
VIIAVLSLAVQLPISIALALLLNRRIRGGTFLRLAVFLRPFMRAIPRELQDAAMVDGASRLRFFVRILLPLSRPALMTVAVLAFVTSWNNYLLPFLVFTSQGKFTLPLGVATFQSTYSQDTAAIFAFTALSMLPALGFFLLAQRRIVGGLSGLAGPRCCCARGARPTYQASCWRSVTRSSTGSPGAWTRAPMQTGSTGWPGSTRPACARPVGLRRTGTGQAGADLRP